MKPIPLDLKTALPKIRKAFDAGKLALGSCAYTGPCAIGIAMHPSQRAALERLDKDETSIGGLFDEGLVEVPYEQEVDFRNLQNVFDNHPDRFEELLSGLEVRYGLKEPVAA